MCRRKGYWIVQTPARARLPLARQSATHPVTHPRRSRALASVEISGHQGRLGASTGGIATDRTAGVIPADHPHHGTARTHGLPGPQMRVALAGGVWHPGRVIGWSGDAPDGWVRIGWMNLTTTAAAVLGTAVSMVVWVIAPGLVQSLALVSPGGSRIWTLTTWPLANGIDLFAILNLFFFWMIGHELESTLGRQAMAKLLLGIAVISTVLTVLVGLAGVVTTLAGMGTIAFQVFLLWIAENPRRPMFFQIPAWVLGAALLGVSAAQLLAYRAWGSLLVLLLGTGLVALWARQLGLLSGYRWLPLWRRRRLSAVRADVVQARQARHRAADDQRLDDLLAKISSCGLDSLTSAERRELERLRIRRRNR